MSRRRPSRDTGTWARGLEPVHAFVAAWEFECCGTPLRPGDTVDVRLGPVDVALPVDAPGPVDRILERHGPRPSPSTHDEGVVTRLWEVWRTADGETVLFETWRTAPFSGSESAQIADRPGYVSPTDDHLGWVVELRV